jgi:hypothetical protein
MKVCDIRGWGYLTGKCARALPDDEAVAIQTANENLIAAAPELYAIVASFVEHCTFDTLGKGDNLDNLFAEAKAVLAKAKGGDS